MWAFLLLPWGACPACPSGAVPWSLTVSGDRGSARELTPRGRTATAPEPGTQWAPHPVNTRPVDKSALATQRSGEPPGHVP